MPTPSIPAAAAALVVVRPVACVVALVLAGVSCTPAAPPRALVDERGPRPLDEATLQAIPAPATAATFRAAGSALRLLGARFVARAPVAFARSLSAAAAAPAAAPASAAAADPEHKAWLAACVLVA